MKTTTVKVLKPFHYADDGIHGRDLKVGETHEVVSDVVAGLTKEGFVTENLTEKPRSTSRLAPENAANGGAPERKTGEGEGAGEGNDGDNTPPAVEIPADWQTLQFMSLKALANKFDKSANNKVDCIAAIEAEIARRAASENE